MTSPLRFNIFALMKQVLFGVLIALSLNANAKPQVTSEAELRPAWLVTFRGGFLFGPADSSVRGQWNHDAFKSNLFSIGAFRTFPNVWREIYFFAGSEFGYQTSHESISGGGATASIETT